MCMRRWVAPAARRFGERSAVLVLGPAAAALGARRRGRGLASSTSLLRTASKRDALPAAAAPASAGVPLVCAAPGVPGGAARWASDVRATMATRLGRAALRDRAAGPPPLAIRGGYDVCASCPGRCYALWLLALDCWCSALAAAIQQLSASCAEPRALRAGASRVLRSVRLRGRVGCVRPCAAQWRESLHAWPTQGALASLPELCPV